MSATPTYRCNLCGIDHPIVNGCVEHSPLSGSGSPPDIGATYSPTRDYYLRLRESETPPAPTDAPFEILNAQIAALSDDELLARSVEIVAGLCEKGDRAFRMSIPAHSTDSDFMLRELIRRFASLRESLAGVQQQQHEGKTKNGQLESSASRDATVCE